MMVTHSTGVMWLALVVAVIALLQPLSRWRALFHRSRRALTGAGAIIGLGGAACVAWILLAKTNVGALTASGNASDQLALGDLANGQVAWALQTIAAFPLRNDPAPAIVYALWLVPFVFLLVAGIRSASSRLRLAALVLLTLWVAVPMTLTVLSFDLGGAGLAGPLRAAAGRRIPCTGRPRPQQGTRGPRSDPLRTRGDTVRAGADHLLRQGRVDGGRARTCPPASRAAVLVRSC